MTHNNKPHEYKGEKMQSENIINLDGMTIEISQKPYVALVLLSEQLVDRFGAEAVKVATAKLVLAINKQMPIKEPPDSYLLSRSDEMEIIDRTNRAMDDYGHRNGSDRFVISRQHVQALLDGKILAGNNYEYSFFVALESDAEETE